MKKLCLLLLIVFVASSVQAVDVYLKLMSHGQRMNIGVAGFLPKNATIDEAKLGRQIQGVVRNDLLYSRYFDILSDGPLYTGKELELNQWQDLGAAVLVCGSLRVEKETVFLTTQIFDIDSNSVVWDKTLSDNVRNWRKLAHLVNDEIVLRFTGERGIAHTRIVFSNDSTGSKELCTVDYDGASFERLTSDRSINILPKWASDNLEILYTTFRFGNPDLYAIKADGSGRRAVSTRQGLNTAAAFSPDCSQIALTISKGKNPNLYLLKRDGSMVRQLTFGRAIQTSPSFAPNGREIVYVSDKSGYPQLYIMGLDGANERKLPTDGYCDSPCWSPRGDKIVFSQRQGRDNYDIYIYDLSSTRVSRLTQEQGTNENPYWSPDGRFIVFSSTRSGRKELYIIAADGSGARKLTEQAGNSATPSWSP
jgi:TolB protein